MRIAVTGGAGFIGSHLVEELVRRDHGVTVLDDFSTGRRENLPRDVHVEEVDIRDRDPLRTALARARPDVVVHLAAQMNVRKSLVDPDHDADVNIRGSLLVFRASVEAGARRIVYASSGGAIYGDQPRYPCRETDEPRPASPYGISKLAAEHYGRHLALASGREFVALRLANVYGPRQNSAGESGVVAIFLEKMLSGGRPAIFGDGRQTRDFVWVGDVVEAIVLAFGGPEGTFNIGSEKETRILDLYEELCRGIGFAQRPDFSPEVVGEVQRNVLSIHQAREKLGWAPRTSLSTGIAAILKDASSRPIAASQE